jgi:hypothetical protein
MPSSLSKALLLALLVAPTHATAENILSREAWGAKPPSLKMTAQKPVAILIHHTGSTQKPKVSLAAKMKSLQRFSQAKEKLADGRTKPAWPDVPYHFYIAANGDIAEGRSITAVGDTNTGYDPTGFIQIVLEGNFETEVVGKRQSESLKSLLVSLQSKYKIDTAKIQGHKDKAQTACPGKDLALRLPEILKSLKN